jgi:hypothetical protein
MEWRGTFEDRFGDTFRLCCDNKTLQKTIEYFIENLLEQEKKRISNYINKLYPTTNSNEARRGYDQARADILFIINSK